MALGKKIETAIPDSDVLSTVGVRERYRPLFQEAREWLKGEENCACSFSKYFRPSSI